MTNAKSAIAALLGTAALVACAPQASTESATSRAEAALPETQITHGNGERNAIALEGATRRASTFTFSSVMIERNGWLVMHPFRDGAPVRDEYVGHTRVPAGTNANVPITVSDDPRAGTMYIVMLHFDMNDDGVFDFGDGITVPDAPAFEGTRMIAHPYAAPAEKVPAEG